MFNNAIRLFLLLAAIGAGCSCASRADGAVELDIDLDGSLQNPCWSPDSARLLLTRFNDGYNRGLSDLALVAAEGGAAEVLVDGAQNVNLPGCWNRATDRIVYTSDVEDRDEVYVMELDADGDMGDIERVTDRPGFQAFEPTFSPDGQRIVFESHPQEVEDQGSIWIVGSDGSDLVQLTDGDGNDRQPNWSPEGDRILFQSQRSGGWDIWTMDEDGGDLENVTDADTDDTDASWSPDATRIVYSSNRGGLDLANIFVIPAEGGTPTQVTEYDGYDGAPAWSPDGDRIAFESFPEEPEESDGTALYVIDAPGQ